MKSRILLKAGTLILQSQVGFSMIFGRLWDILLKHFNPNLDYFARLLSPLSAYLKFSIKAQILLYSDFNSYKFQQSTSNQSNEKSFFIRQSDLSIMTNHIENRLGSRISDASAFEFVTYVPSRQPLFVASNNGSKFWFCFLIDQFFSSSGLCVLKAEAKTNAFLVPRWGGIYVHNTPPKSDQSIQTDQSMRVFMTHFLDLIGIRLNKVNYLLRCN